MGIMVYNPLLWDMQDLYHQPYVRAWAILSLRVTVAAFSKQGRSRNRPGPYPMSTQTHYLSVACHVYSACYGLAMAVQLPIVTVVRCLWAL